MICSQTVFRCFKWMERMADRITGAAGPYFVGLAVFLISLGTICFFDVILPSLSYPLLSVPVCFLIATNLHAHYYYVCTVSPGFVEDPPREVGGSILWAKKKVLSGVRWSDTTRITEAAVTKCKKCGQGKPELQWVNQCVGLHNERHFVLFMAYLVLSTCCFAVLGYPQLLLGLGISSFEPWPYRVPVVAYILTYILSVVLCFAVGVMCSYHLWTVSCGETSVEAQDHEVYRKLAKSRGETFVNSYDLGRRRNLVLFFNIGQNGYPWYTLIFPLRIMPYTDGRAWARREGHARHRGVREGEELTDEDDDE